MDLYPGHLCGSLSRSVDAGSCWQFMLAGRNDHDREATKPENPKRKILARSPGDGPTSTVAIRIPVAALLGDQHLDAAALEFLGVGIGYAVIGDEGMDQFKCAKTCEGGAVDLG